MNTFTYNNIDCQNETKKLLGLYEVERYIWEIIVHQEEEEDKMGEQILWKNTFLGLFYVIRMIRNDTTKQIHFFS
ncbi:hypothetical protein BLOT_003391 [Blomia tropicalis]|nr:hypothetical protein BLOT_003391 [Blomia tropicalis]